MKIGKIKKMKMCENCEEFKNCYFISSENNQTITILCEDCLNELCDKWKEITRNKNKVEINKENEDENIEIHSRNGITAIKTKDQLMMVEDKIILNLVNFYFKGM